MDEIPNGVQYRVNKLTVSEQTAMSTTVVHHFRRDSFSTCSEADISAVKGDTRAFTTEEGICTR
jgi:hypothetical protein